MLAIPMMSTKYKRVFSSTKHLLIDTRNYLHPNIIEANECLKHWFGKLEDEVDHKANILEEVVATKARVNNKSDIENDINYEVDSNGEIV